MFSLHHKKKEKNSQKSQCQEALQKSLPSQKYEHLMLVWQYFTFLGKKLIKLFKPVWNDSLLIVWRLLWQFANSVSEISVFVIVTSFMLVCYGY